jgi:diguanylate cyclase (GGDEF)-like protein
MLGANPQLEFQEAGRCLPLLGDSLVVPIILESECYGTISLYNDSSRKYTQSDLGIMQAIAGLVAPLLSDGTPIGQRSKPHLRGPLTQTSRIGYLSIVGTEMLSQAEKKESPLSLLLIEVKGLDQVVSLDGTATGESVLVRVADALRAELRETDALVQYGHQGFAAFLAGVRGDQVARFSRRLQQVASSALGGIVKAQPPVIRLQIGTASFPNDGPSVFALLQSAQRSMGEQGIVGCAAVAEIDCNVLEFPPRF